MQNSTHATDRSRAALAAALASLALLAACGGDEPAPSGAGGTAQERPLADGKAVYQRAQLMCVLCHGKNGEGNAMGPPLAGVEAQWTLDDLASFVRDPVQWLGTKPHLTALHANYPQPMPKPNPEHISESDARVLARWLMAGMPQ